jgi:hypothetical protein
MNVERCFKAIVFFNIREEAESNKGEWMLRTRWLALGVVSREGLRANCVALANV